MDFTFHAFYPLITRPVHWCAILTPGIIQPCSHFDAWNISHTLFIYALPEVLIYTRVEWSTWRWSALRKDTHIETIYQRWEGEHDISLETCTDRGLNNMTGGFYCNIVQRFYVLKPLDIQYKAKKDHVSRRRPRHLKPAQYSLFPAIVTFLRTETFSSYFIWHCFQGYATGCEMICRFGWFLHMFVQICGDEIN